MILIFVHLFPWLRNSEFVQTGGLTLTIQEPLIAARLVLVRARRAEAAVRQVVLAARLHLDLEVREGLLVLLSLLESPRGQSKAAGGRGSVFRSFAAVESLY